MTVAFFGHRDAAQSLQPKLQNILVHLIEKENADVFYVGNEGNFDFMVQRTLSVLSLQYPHIRCFAVLAYLPKSRQEFLLETVYPEGLEETPMRFAICKRNEWMLSQVDAVITHVVLSAGNSSKMRAKAIRKGKRVINVL